MSARRVDTLDGLLELDSGTVLVTDFGEIYQVFDTRGEGRIVRTIGDEAWLEIMLVELPAWVIWPVDIGRT